ncbi:MAG: hypothetical protein LWY06_15810, partial [Firmicutes bacterium]|nr:hypothetical protein [Bacillota bacterium]
MGCSFKQTASDWIKRNKLLFCFLLLVLTAGGFALIHYLSIFRIKNSPAKTGNLILITCEPMSNPRLTNDSANKGTIFKFRLFDIKKEKQSSNKLISEHLLPFEQKEHSSVKSEWKNLLHNGGKWFFINNTDKGWMYFEMFFDSVNERIVIGNVKKIYHSFDENHILAV